MNCVRVWVCVCVCVCVCEREREGVGMKKVKEEEKNVKGVKWHTLFFQSKQTRLIFYACKKRTRANEVIDKNTVNPLRFIKCITPKYQKVSLEWHYDCSISLCFLNKNLQRTIVLYCNSTLKRYFNLNYDFSALAREISVLLVEKTDKKIWL